MPSIPQSYDKYRWRVSKDDSSVHERHALGIDRVVDHHHRHHRGQDYISIGVDLSFTDAVSPDDLVRAARQAWATLRYNIPMIAATTCITEKDDPVLVYRTASNHATVTAWAERTVAITQSNTLADARVEIDRRKPVIPDEQGDQTFIYIVPRGSDQHYAVVLYSTHVPFDGVGCQVIMTHYLAIMARYIADGRIASREHSGLEWGREAKNLTLPYFEVAAETEPLEGPAFDETINQLLGEMDATMPRAHPFRFREAPGGPDAPRHIEHVFSKEETTRIVHHVKSKGLTLNHLVHAAIALATLLDNPSPTDDALFVNMGIYNARERLRMPYSQRLQYTGTATVASILQAPVSSVLGTNDVQRRLDIISHELKSQYSRQRSFPALLGVNATMVDMIMPSYKAASPFANTNKCIPRFAADGIGEWHLDPEYTDAAGKLVFRITEFFMCPRVMDSNAWFRAHTWRGRLKLSCDYNAAMLPTEASEGFLRTVAGLLITAASVTPHRL